jgi:hypothetical protein
VGEVEEADGFVDYRKAEGYEGINTACDYAIKKELIHHDSVG